MMCYYVIYEDKENDENVVKFATEDLVCGFIERTVELNSGYEIGDFEVIHGRPLNIRVETKRVVRLGI